MHKPTLLHAPVRALCTATLALCGLSAVHANVVVQHVLNRGQVFSNTHMCAVTSSGESLADRIPAQPGHCPNESAPGDMHVQVTWSDGTSASAIWGFPSGSNKPNAGKLFPNLVVPGVHFDFVAQNQAGVMGVYRAFVEQSGDTFTNPWEIRNGSGDYEITEVLFTARGTPDMGFDTDSGANPIHGAGGFLLFVDEALSDYGDGGPENLVVTYDQFNNWNGSTDIFHQMRLGFTQGLDIADSLVFHQDTDEKIPEPGSLALVALALAALRLLPARRR